MKSEIYTDEYTSKFASMTINGFYTKGQFEYEKDLDSIRSDTKYLWTESAFDHLDLSALTQLYSIGLNHEVSSLTINSSFFGQDFNVVGSTVYSGFYAIDPAAVKSLSTLKFMDTLQCQIKNIEQLTAVRVVILLKQVDPAVFYQFTRLPNIQEIYLGALKLTISENKVKAA